MADTDAVYRAFMDHAFQQLDDATASAIVPRLPEGVSREYLAGQAAGLLRLIQSIEDTRRRAREFEQQEERRRAARR